MTTTREEFETKLRSEQKGPLAAVPIGEGRGAAYFRRPTAEEWDTFQALSGDPGGQAVAYKRMVSQCFVGGWTSLGELTLAQIEELEGPGFLPRPAGNAVNKLAGSDDRPTRFL